jgi:hypothetical protein
VLLHYPHAVEKEKRPVADIPIVYTQTNLFYQVTYITSVIVILPPLSAN